MLKRVFGLAKQGLKKTIPYICKATKQKGFVKKIERNVITNVLQDLSKSLTPWIEKLSYDSVRKLFEPFDHGVDAEDSKTIPIIQEGHVPPRKRWSKLYRNGYWALKNQELIRNGFHSPIRNQQETRVFPEWFTQQKKRKHAYHNKHYENILSARDYHANLHERNRSETPLPGPRPVPTVLGRVVKEFRNKEEEKHHIQDPVGTGPTCFAGCMLCGTDDNGLRRRNKLVKHDKLAETEIFASHALNTGRSFEEDRFFFYQTGYDHPRGNRKRKIQQIYILGDPTQNDINAVLLDKKRKISHIDPMLLMPTCYGRSFHNV